MENGIDKADVKLRQPDWLKTGVIRGSDVEDARKILEFTSKPADTFSSPGALETAPMFVVKDVPTGRDIALHGALKIYRIVSNILHNSREKARSVLLEELTYILTNWSNFSTGIDVSNMKMRWVSDNDDDSAQFHNNVVDIPKTSKNPSRSVEIDQTNDKLYEALLTSHPGMVLCVQHDVHVVGIPQNSSRGQQDTVRKSRKRQGGVKMVLKRLVNLAEVATKFCVAYTQSSSKEYAPEQFLRSNIDALRAIGSISSLLRLFVRKFMALNLDSRGRLRGTAVNLSNINFGSFTLESLIPGNSVVRRIRISCAFRLTEKEFDVLNVMDRVRGNRDGEEPSGASESRDIVACEADGIREV